jgi:hypothetical protein
LFDEYATNGVGNDRVLTSIGGSNIDTWDLGVGAYLDNSTYKRIDIQYIRGTISISIDGTRTRTFSDSNERGIMSATNTWFSISARTGSATNIHRVKNIRVSKIDQGLWSLTSMSNSSDLLYPYGNVSVMGNVGVGSSNPQYKLDVLGGPALFRNGNSTGTFSNSQLLLGWNNTASFMHSIKTRHNSGGNDTNNAIDLFVWQTTDAASNVGTKHIMSVTS